MKTKTASEMRCTQEYVHDPEGDDYRVALGERRQSDDPIVRETPHLWETADPLPVGTGLLRCTTSFTSQVGDAAAGKTYRPDDPLVNVNPSVFVPENLSTEEIESLRNQQSYNAPEAWKARKAERKAAAEELERAQQRKLAEAEELERKVEAARAEADELGERAATLRRLAA